jgi:hypothetical protein
MFLIVNVSSSSSCLEMREQKIQSTKKKKQRKKSFVFFHRMIAKKTATTNEKKRRRRRTKKIKTYLYIPRRRYLFFCFKFFKQYNDKNNKEEDIYPLTRNEHIYI